MTNMRGLEAEFALENERKNRLIEKKKYDWIILLLSITIGVLFLSTTLLGAFVALQGRP